MLWLSRQEDSYSGVDPLLLGETVTTSDERHQPEPELYLTDEIKPWTRHIEDFRSFFFFFPNAQGLLPQFDNSGVTDSRGPEDNRQ